MATQLGKVIGKNPPYSAYELLDENGKIIGYVICGPDGILQNCPIMGKEEALSRLKDFKDDPGPKSGGGLSP